ncbi:mitotic checkpoint protein bub3.3 [Phtheirospermum japonicum]|uniref:Mitotic checkpoint protein bub3.3 n=1 Tax=Phtheirospermum japonicum TaxID=374723 RepID=A0A830CIL2_9LAMI|nr:mitotic checkpoint protein bub3.3 [Phtheirospermum japonicum]
MHLYDLRYLNGRPQVKEPFTDIPIKCVRSSSGLGGFMVGSTDGRVALEYLGESNSQKDGLCGVLVTGDNEGHATIWDVQNKKRLMELPKYPNSAASLSYNHSRQLLAVASSYTYQEAMGAMGALFISSWFVVFGEFVYIFGGWCPDTWKGFTLAAMKDLLPVVKLSISSESRTLLIAVEIFSLNISSWIIMGILGIMGAACVRIANELGRGDAKDDCLGGHANTVTVDGTRLDIGFQVFNRVTYPNMMELFESLGVDMEPSDMSFSVRLADGQGCIWGTRNGFSSLFAQKKNIFNPQFLKMIREINKFNEDGKNYTEELDNNQDLDLNETLGHFLPRGSSNHDISSNKISLVVLHFGCRLTFKILSFYLLEL